MPDKINFLFLTLYNVDAFDIGVALVIQGNIVLMGQGYDFLISIYRVFTLIVAVHAYLTVKIAINDVRLKTVKILWIFVGIFTMGRPFLYLIDLVSLLELTPAIRSFPDLVAVIIITSIVVRFPECVLISKSQLIRASYLYKKIKSGEFGQKRIDVGLSVLYAYLSELPPEFFELSTSGSDQGRLS
ncbi:MAG: hypothetical protein JSW11_08935 [Candidatus Heimdallarchaeota archaeon]|nr:MAG: hypothetical protein JSW11_08935 [Candidatus Heimdallarchaeota archaeon]